MTTSGGIACPARLGADHVAARVTLIPTLSTLQGRIMGPRPVLALVGVLILLAGFAQGCRASTSSDGVAAAGWSTLTGPTTVSIADRPVHVPEGWEGELVRSGTGAATIADLGEDESAVLRLQGGQPGQRMSVVITELRESQGGSRYAEFLASARGSYKALEGTAAAVWSDASWRVTTLRAGATSDDAEGSGPLVLAVNQQTHGPAVVVSLSATQPGATVGDALGLLEAMLLR